MIAHTLWLITLPRARGHDGASHSSLEAKTIDNKAGLKHYQASLIGGRVVRQNPAAARLKGRGLCPTPPDLW